MKAAIAAQVTKGKKRHAASSAGLPKPTICDVSAYVEEMAAKGLDPDLFFRSETDGSLEITPALAGFFFGAAEPAQSFTLAGGRASTSR